VRPAWVIAWQRKSAMGFKVATISLRQALFIS